MVNFKIQILEKYMLSNGHLKNILAMILFQYKAESKMSSRHL